MGVTTPSGWVVGELLHSKPVGETMFWLTANKRKPCSGEPITTTGVGARGIESRRVWGPPAKTSTAFSHTLEGGMVVHRSVAHSPADGEYRFKGFAVLGSVLNVTFLACRVLEIGILVRVPSVLRGSPL